MRNSWLYKSNSKAVVAVKNISAPKVLIYNFSKGIFMIKLALI